MNNVILGCEILEDEIRKAIAETGAQDQVIWMDSALHMFPQKLRDRLQEEIQQLDSQPGIDNILLTFGYCGNAILGLKSENSNLVLPRVSDCIDLFLYDSPDKISLRTQGCYFLTKGWLKSKHSIVNEYDRHLEKYGEKRARRTMEAMLGHYKNFMLLDTEAYSLEEYTSIAEAAASKLNLQLCCRKGSIDLLIKLFSGDWDENFCIIPPGSAISLDHFETMELAPSQGQAV